ncbi:MAG: VTT domain-containing protein [Acidobacteriales bacterium]|nr:VTT domain-containing protein [Terriglobales bacterium]
MGELLTNPLSGTVALAVSIILATFVSEDGATVLAASLAAAGMADTRVALGSAFVGIWLGDIGLYGIARALGDACLRNSFARRFVSPDALTRAEVRFRQSGGYALVASRFIPGTRLPTYLAAGALRMRFRSFALVTAMCGVVWVSLVFLLTTLIGGQVLSRFVTSPYHSWALFGFGAMILSTLILIGRFSARFGGRVRLFVEKYRRWEFWPMWLFYPPVVVMCAWLAIKYRGISLPTIANPSLHTGGIIGESKFQYLASLSETAPEFTADAYLVPPGDPATRTRTLHDLFLRRRLYFPFVLKPDIAQRGDGFKRIASFEAAENYLRAVPGPVVMQRYAPGPREAGIFYYRFPGEAQGHIFAITEKEFPVVTGDGVQTFEELVDADSRAALIAETYRARFPQLQGSILPAGEKLRLVEAGNHCQGCIFRDGMHLATEALRARIDEISRQLPGFFIGRYDVRYASDDDLRAGRDFQIVELNGSSAEATSIYDPRNSLWEAYRTLYRQWDLVFAIGQANRDRGHRPSSVGEVWREWLAYRRQSVLYPLAD